MTNVISINGGEVPQLATPQESVIEALENALEAARSGRVQGVAFVTLESDGMASYTVAGLVTSYSLLGGLDMARDFIVGAIKESA